MKLVVQRVKSAKVAVKGKNVAAIKRGLLLLVGIGRDDSEGDIAKVAQKLASLRIFEDAEGKINLAIRQVKGQILSVPQFTLYADTGRGNRPGFDRSYYRSGT